MKKKIVANFFYTHIRKQQKKETKGLIVCFEEACVVGVTFALILNFVLFVLFFCLFLTQSIFHVVFETKIYATKTKRQTICVEHIHIDWYVHYNHQTYLLSNKICHSRVNFLHMQFENWTKSQMLQRPRDVYHDKLKCRLKLNISYVWNEASNRYSKKVFCLQQKRYFVSCFVQRRTIKQSR